MTTTTPRIATRLAAHAESIFGPITRLALEHDAINLGQGAPDFDGPAFIQDAAIEAMRSGHNQYARPYGVLPLVEAIADWAHARGGRTVDPLTDVTVTAGCTEAIPATILGLIEPGDEVVVLEPFYDSYPAVLSMAGATMKPVTLHAPSFTWDPDELRRAFSPRTRAVMVNTPHNPTGRVFSRAEMEQIAALCLEHDALAITDEVYECLVFDGEHVAMASIDGMAERTITLSSLGKTFSYTGWKIGWAIAPPHLTAGIRATHQYLTFTVAHPFQYGAAAALRAPQSYFDTYLAEYRERRDVMISGLRDAGFTVDAPQGTYFAMADYSALSDLDDLAFVHHLVEHVGVAAIPPSSFYATPDPARRLLRFGFCKQLPNLKAGMERLRAVSSSR